MKDFQNYTESPYIDMRNPFGFDGNFGCACNPCHRPPIPNCNRPIRPPMQPPENCFPPQQCCDNISNFYNFYKKNITKYVIFFYKF